MFMKLIIRYSSYNTIWICVHLNKMAITNVKDETVLNIDATNVGEVHFILAKNMLIVKPTLFFFFFCIKTRKEK